jgi:serine/threonine protein kinase
MIGRVLGHYKVIEQVGSGGMGVVYRARDERLERDVALKVLSTGSLGTDQARSQLRKEALALAQLSHAHVGAVYDFDTHDGVDFLVMEYVADRHWPTGGSRLRPRADPRSQRTGR